MIVVDNYLVQSFSPFVNTTYIGLYPLTLSYPSSMELWNKSVSFGVGTSATIFRNHGNKPSGPGTCHLALLTYSETNSDSGEYTKKGL